METKRRPGRKPGHRQPEETRAKIAATWAERNRMTELGKAMAAAMAAAGGRVMKKNPG